MVEFNKQMHSNAYEQIINDDSDNYSERFMSVGESIIKF